MNRSQKHAILSRKMQSRIDVRRHKPLQRNQLIDRVEVLSKVKALFLIPGIEMMSTKMVAEFYEVDSGTLRVCYNRNKKEIDSDGTFVRTSKELRGSLQNVTTLKKDNNYKTFVALSNGEQAELMSKSTYFSPRAVLRIGMLLRDSEVAPIYTGIPGESLSIYLLLSKFTGV